MNAASKYRIAAVVLAAVFSGCSNGGGPASSIMPAPLSRQPDAAPANTTATLSIAIPQAAAAQKNRGKRPHYVSPATQSISISFKPTKGLTKRFSANLTTTTNKNCKFAANAVRCQITLTLKVGKYEASFATYDGLLNGLKQPTGHELSASQDVPITITSNPKHNVIRVALSGVPASVAFVPGPSSTLSGNAEDGYTLSRCSATSQQASVLGVDADGNYILGDGAPTPSLVSGSTSITVSNPSRSSPNTFTLVPPTPPTYAGLGAVDFLEAVATPQSGGGKPATAVVKITFTSEICGVFTEFPIPTASSHPLGITAGADGAIWFTEYGTDKIGRIPTTATVANPNITEYSVPTANSGPEEIASSSDGSLWFSECYVGQIGRIASGSPILEFRIATPGAKPRGITQGPDGAMWFAESGGNKIGRIPTSGPVTIQEYTVTGTPGPSGIVTGPDGALWFTEATGNNIGRITTTGAPITETPIGGPVSLPRAIAVGPNDALWFTQCAGLNVGYVPVTGGSSSLFPVTLSGVGLYGITQGPDGAMWFVEANGNSVVRITQDGGSTQAYPVPTFGGEPRFIVVGPDNALWFTEFNSGKIGRLQ